MAPHGPAFSLPPLLAHFLSWQIEEVSALMFDFETFISILPLITGLQNKAFGSLHI